MPRFLPRALSRQRRPPRPGTAEHRPVKLLHIGTAMTLTLIAAGTLAALLLGGALTWLGLPETTGKKYSLKTLLDIIKISLAVVGGVGGAVALVVAYRKQRLAEEENERARQAARREDTKLYAERFDKAGDKLGAESAAVRLAGVHALAALADDWEGGRQMCIDVLCAYLRMPPEPEPDADSDPAGHATWTALREVRATIIRLIATHLRANAPTPWHGADLDFTGVDFTDDVDFADTVFSGGRVSFIGAKFSGGTVWFADAEFSGSLVSFIRAEFSGSWISFIGAKFSGGRVWFADAKFSGGRVTFADAKFSGGLLDFAEVVDWSRPPDGLPVSAPGLKLPPQPTPPAAPDSAV